MNLPRWPDPLSKVDLRRRWRAFSIRQGHPGPVDEWFARLAQAHAAAARPYHNLQHLAEVLSIFDLLRHEADHPDAAELALWFHDAIYVPGAGDNEERSAALAAEFMRELPNVGPLKPLVRTLILATRNHPVSEDRDMRVVIDSDLSIFGQTPERFAEYERQIRAEYAFVPLDEFLARRRVILREFFDRPRIYQTKTMYQFAESAARANLAGVLAGNAG